jgi:hypothetical protein
MPFTALKQQATDIPPDLSAVLSAPPVHPDLARVPRRESPPTAAELSLAALNWATFAAANTGMEFDLPPLDASQHVPLGIRGFLHSVGRGGVLHLKPTGALRAVTLARGTLVQRCAQWSSLTPGAVRIVPAGHALTLADLSGGGALAVEVTLGGAT